MGCDIHLYVERRANPSHDWESAQKWTACKDDDGWPSVSPEFYDGRSYKLFSILADVRNGHGFAGVDTGNCLNVIAPPRGLPSDVSPNIRAHSDRWDCDGHSHSWLTVAEIMAFDWTQTATCRGVLNGSEFEKWDRWGRQHGEQPESWCGDVSGLNVKHISERAMEQLARKARKKAEANRADWDKIVAEETKDYYTKVQWEVPYHVAIDSSFLSRTLPMLWRLGSPENVRIVFWFDN